MNILLTGGAGYIGSNVILALIEQNHNIHVIDDLSTGDQNILPTSIEFTKCNINDANTIEKIIKNNKFDVLMHFAGFIQVEESVKFPEKYFENNTKNSIDLFETCKKNNLNKIIFSSTASGYGNSENDLISENHRLNPQNPYAESKVRTEEYLIKNKKDFKSVILRYFNVAGADTLLRAGQISKTSTHLIKILSEVAIGKRDKIEIFGNDYNTADGTAIRDYIHVSDLADIHVKVADYLMKKNESNIFNCGYGIGFSVLEVINTANKICNGKINYRFSGRRNGDVEKLVSNISKINNYIKWIPKHNNLETIINSSIEWEKKLNEKNI